MKRFSQEEKEILLKHIRVNATNLKKAFKDAAEELGNVREWRAFADVWYRNVRKTAAGRRAFRLIDQNGTVYVTKNVAINSKERVLATKISSMDNAIMQLASQPNTAANRAAIARIVRAKQALLKH